jgi:hypothetical protein
MELSITTGFGASSCARWRVSSELVGTAGARFPGFFQRAQSGIGAHEPAAFSGIERPCEGRVGIHIPVLNCNDKLTRVRRIAGKIGQRRKWRTKGMDRRKSKDRFGQSGQAALNLPIAAICLADAYHAHQARPKLRYGVCAQVGREVALGIWPIQMGDIPTHPVLDLFNTACLVVLQPASGSTK